jgi:hypothetical protein
MACLDHYFVNLAWTSQYPTSHTSSSTRVISDHSPFFLEFGVLSKFKNNIFDRCSFYIIFAQDLTQ